MKTTEATPLRIIALCVLALASGLLARECGWPCSLILLGGFAAGRYFALYL